MAENGWILGVDGGATTTTALLAEAGSGRVVGRGCSGPSNIQAVGETAALRELNAAVSAAFAAAGVARQPVAAAVLGLAGIDLDGEDVIRGWAELVDLAAKLEVVNDARLLFAAGTPQGWGLAVIAGTGSIAYARTPDGHLDRCGGWGWLLGDEGSAFQIGLQALRAACRAADGIAPDSRIPQMVLAQLGSNDLRDLIPAVYRGRWDKAFIAQLAPQVLHLAWDGDPLALPLVQREIDKLAATAVSLVRRTALPTEQLPLALGGGLLLNDPRYRQQFLESLQRQGLHPEPVRIVEEPALGALVLAQQMAKRVE